MLPDLVGAMWPEPCRSREPDGKKRQRSRRRDVRKSSSTYSLDLRLSVLWWIIVDHAKCISTLVVSDCASTRLKVVNSKREQCNSQSESPRLPSRVPSSSTLPGARPGPAAMPMAWPGPPPDATRRRRCRGAPPPPPLRDSLSRALYRSPVRYLQHTSIMVSIAVARPRAARGARARRTRVPTAVRRGVGATTTTVHACPTEHRAARDDKILGISPISYLVSSVRYSTVRSVSTTRAPQPHDTRQRGGSASGP